MKTAISAALLLGLLAGCAGLPAEGPPAGVLARPAAEDAATVVVFRESAMAARLVGLQVGLGEQAFAQLDNGEKLQVQLPAGAQVLFVRARRAEPTRLPVTLERGATVCLRASANPSTYAKVLLPVALMATGYHFYLDRVPCPAEAVLSTYPSVAVTYR